MKTPISGSPDEFAENLYWEYNKFENLTTDEVKRLCISTLDILMQEVDTHKRVYYKTAKEAIKNRGNI
ncbi:MAG: hypothetical protein WC055_02065 [Melioribacteraceae bacterium]